MIGRRRWWVAAAVVALVLARVRLDGPALVLLDAEGAELARLTRSSENA